MSKKSLALAEPGRPRFTTGPYSGICWQIARNFSAINISFV
jgi:hypothetical protein